MKEKDDFWNIERIMPQKKPSAHNSDNVKCADVLSRTEPSFSKGADIATLISSVNENRGMNSFESAIVKEKDYSHFANSNVMCFAYTGTYNSFMVYENKIRSHALSLYGKKSLEDAPFVDYFSFMPCFSELSQKQLDYYLYWREKVKLRERVCASPSYAFLYITEIVNLPDKICPDAAIHDIIYVWKEYLSYDKKYFKLMSDIVFEYCIVHDLPIPFEELKDLFYSIEIPTQSLLLTLFIYDYLVTFSKEHSQKDIEFIFKNTLSYTFQSGKHYSSNAQFKDLTDKYFYKILTDFINEKPEFFEQIFDKHRKRSSPIKTVKPAYLSLHTSLEIKKNLVFEYYVFDKNDVELQHLINVAKLIENKFRTLCSIRARLSVTPPESDVKTLIDSLFSPLFNRFDPKALSYVPKKPKKVCVDIKNAHSIELASWDATRQLTQGIDVFEEEEAVVTPTVLSNDNSDVSDFIRLLNDTELYVFTSVFKKSLDAAKKFCFEKGLFFDSVVSDINEKASDVFGDVLIDVESKEIYSEYYDDVSSYFYKEK